MSISLRYRNCGNAAFLMRCRRWFSERFFFFLTQEFGREHPQVPSFIKSLLYKQVDVASYQREFEVEGIRTYPFAYGVLIFVLFHCYAIFMLLDGNFVYRLLCGATSDHRRKCVQCL